MDDKVCSCMDNECSGPTPEGKSTTVAGLCTSASSARRRPSPWPSLGERGREEVGI